MFSPPMTTKLFCISLLIFFSLGVGGSNGSFAESESSYHILSVSSLFPKAVCSTSKDHHRSALVVTHQHGPCSPLGTKDVKLTTTQMLQQDQSRVELLQSRISGKAQGEAQIQTSQAQSTLPVRSGRLYRSGNFVVTIGFGTPKKDMTVIFDTASDLTWIQCEPCARSCYSQKEKVFNPAQSSTYNNVSCDSAECGSVGSATGSVGCSASTCLYGIQYGDQSYSVGFYGHEKVTISPTDVFQDFGFGCGQKNQGLFGTTAGLLGLGRNIVSFVSQTFDRYKGLFSYCLPSTPSSTGYLSFGGYKASSRLKFTPLLTDKKNPSFYFIELIGISVGGRKLSISPTIFKNGGTLIDSGTVITRLPPSAYAALRLAFKKAMSKYPPASPLSILDTCYDFSKSTTIAVPKIELIFEGGANVNVDISGIMVASTTSQVCLAFAGNGDANDPTIIGNKQQQTYEVVYDTSKRLIGFGPGGCN